MASMNNEYVEQVDDSDDGANHYEVSENVKNKVVKFNFEFMDPQDNESGVTTPDRNRHSPGEISFAMDLKNDLELQR